MKNKPPKYRVNKTFSINDKLFCTGDILMELPEGYDYDKDQKNKSPKITLQHAFTGHSV